MKRFGCLFMLLVLCGCDTVSESERMAHCAKSCKDAGSSMKTYDGYWNKCECHNPLEIKFGTSK